MMITVRLTKLKQYGRDLYVGAMRAEDIIRLGRVAEWVEGRVDGYQRAPTPSRISKLAKFLQDEADPLLPSSILLSHRGPPLPKRAMAANVFDIDLADDGVLWIVDGQHRVGGLKYAIDILKQERFREFELPVVLMEFESITEEAKQFQLVNENMKKVDTGLVRRILHMQLEVNGEDGREKLRKANRLWEAESIEILTSLTSDRDSVWYGRVQVANQKKAASHVARELSFTQSLKPILRSELAKEMTTELFAKFISNYWYAWAEIVPDAFAEPTNYVIQKNSGIFILHRVALYVLRFLAQRQNLEPTVDQLRELLRYAGEAAHAEYWLVGNRQGAATAQSMGGNKMISDTIVGELRNNGLIV